MTLSELEGAFDDDVTTSSGSSPIMSMADPHESYIIHDEIPIIPPPPDNEEEESHSNVPGQSSILDEVYGVRLLSASSLLSKSY